MPGPDPGVQFSSACAMDTYYVYILASQRNGTLYIDVTNNLSRRVYGHKDGLAEGFTKRYGVGKLVRFETFNDIHAAIPREKAIKHWSRSWKTGLIERENPEWDDLYERVNS